MNRVGTALSQVLVGTLAEGTAQVEVSDALVTAGRLPDDVVVLAGPNGLDELLGHDRGSGILGRITSVVRRIEALDSDGTGHVLGSAMSDLRSGRTVVLVRHVDRRAAGSLTEVLRRHGVAHVHYIGRWTVATAGAVPSVAA
jgi:hypothetical protein